jgi:peptidyl-dipeptidase A
MESGASRPWPDILEEFTGSREVSAAAMLEYFDSLNDWLREDNSKHRENLGWRGATINWGEE